MTKIIIHGVDPKEEKELKPIEFTRCVDSSMMEFKDAASTPNKFKEINVFKKNEGYGFDLFVCYDKMGRRYVYFGNLNDGVIE